jgi:hypothetical protein
MLALIACNGTAYAVFSDLPILRTTS